MGEIIRLLGQTIIKPNKTFEEMVRYDEKKALSTAWKGIGLVYLLYALTLTGYILAGKPAMMPMIVKLPDSIYFVWAIFVGCPVVIFLYMMAAGAMVLLSRRAGGSGSIFQTFTVAVYAFSVPALLYWLFETIVLFILIAMGLNEPRLFLLLMLVVPIVLAVIWSAVLAIKAVRITQNIPFKWSVLTGFVVNLFFWGIAAVFIA